ncbi:inovirus-type Gp2 protein [Halomonas sp. Alg239-R46]|uniref:YagK/YfjJ domain-containing protein n=1 Tax=Halomonas sp. Alg239-R46 TaxID=2993445 RepID=UPI00248ECC3F|nr:inovirus-type Gp2 protein [Halomonas sp. Alg239-R46]
MRRNNHSITKSKTWKGYHLYDRTQNKVEDGFYIKILDQLRNGLEGILEAEGRINVIRFDISIREEDQFIPTGETTNKAVSELFRILRRRIKAWKDKSGKNRKINNLFYGWVREESAAKSEHYHCFIAFKAQSNKRVPIYDTKAGKYIWIYKTIVDAWEEASLVGQINFGSRVTDRFTGEIKQDNEFYYIEKAKDTGRKSLREAYKGLSYLAKVATKGNQPKDQRMFNFSRPIGTPNPAITQIKALPTTPYQ